MNNGVLEHLTTHKRTNGSPKTRARAIFQVENVRFVKRLTGTRNKQDAKCQIEDRK